MTEHPIQLVVASFWRDYKEWADTSDRETVYVYDSEQMSGYDRADVILLKDWNRNRSNAECQAMIGWMEFYADKERSRAEEQKQINAGRFPQRRRSGLWLPGDETQ